MKIGIVGYQSSGKSTLFEWLTEIAPDPSLGHTAQNAMTPVPDERIAALCEIYQPKKITKASLELVDTPGLDRKHDGNAARLALIRGAGCLLFVVAAYDGSDAMADINSFDEDLLLADMEIVAKRVEKLAESVKKPRPTRDQEQAELDALRPLLETLEAGKPLTEVEMTEEQHRATRSFQLLTEKPALVIVNVADDEEDLTKYSKHSDDRRTIVAAPLGLELELAKMSPEDRREFQQEMGLEGFDRDGLLKAILDASRQMIYFTAGDTEVRTWMLRQGGTALEAADNIHSDLARGFIRAETMTCDDLIRLGSEREIKAQNLMRSEFKDYVVKDGDILHIRFSV